MTTPIANIDNTTLLNLTPNLDIGDIADPALRLAYFQYLNVYIQTITTAFNAFVTNGGIGTANLADLSVTTAKIALLAVTAAQLADGAVTSAKILDGTIATGDIADLAITTAKLALLSVTASQIANATITTTQLATGAVASVNILDNTIVNTDISTTAAIAWSKINKASSSLADLTTRLITDLTGILAATQFPALTGDITTIAGALATTLKNTGTPGTYKSVTTDAQGRVTTGTNPTTLAGYGITDAAPLTHVGSGGSAHPQANASVDGFMSAAAYNYLFGLTPSGLGSFNVPADTYITFGPASSPLFKVGLTSATNTLDIFVTG